MPDYTLDPGKLRHRVEIQRVTRAQDPATGYVTEDWQTIARPFASVEPVSVKEFVAAGAEQASVDHRIVMRYRRDVDATCRVIHRGDAFNVRGVLPDPVSGREYITLACEAGATDG